MNRKKITHINECWNKFGRFRHSENAILCVLLFDRFMKYELFANIHNGPSTLITSTIVWKLNSLAFSIIMYQLYLQVGFSVGTKFAFAQFAVIVKNWAQFPRNSAFLRLPPQSHLRANCGFMAAIFHICAAKFARLL